jgi:hypothetical protein
MGLAVPWTGGESKAGPVVRSPPGFIGAAARAARLLTIPDSPIEPFIL